ncbi:MAG TPA: sigma-70 family RNA polymerase sigma factor [Kofleriaceae bacterium]
MQAFGTPTSRTPSTRDRLIRDHAAIARRIALRVARRCPEWVAREDLISAGMVGLVEAADRYDHSRQEPFISFAEHRIRGAILDELRRGDIMPRRVRQLARKISAAITELEKDGEQASDQRVADALGVSVNQYQAGLAQLVHVEVAPLDGEATRLAANDELPDAQANHRQTLARVCMALDRLEARDAMILGLHYVEDLTYQEIADTLKITPSRVCQLLWRAVDRIRAHLGAEVEQPQPAAAS